MLVGSFSSNFYGTPRSTQDVDLVISLKPAQSIQHVIDNLGSEFELLPQMSFELFTATKKHELSVRNSAFRIELFHLSNDAHDQERFQRRQEVQVFDQSVWLPTPEDVVITKLRWLRPKDEEDVRNVLAAQAERLDWSYIQHWCQQHETTTALQRLRNA